MGIPIFDSSKETLLQGVETSSNVNPAMLSLLARSLPPDRLRVFLQILLTTLQNKDESFFFGLSNLLVNSLNPHETVSDILLPRKNENSLLPPHKIWSDEQIEKSLSDGTSFSLVPSLTMSRFDNDNTSNLRWVWRSTSVQNRGSNFVRSQNPSPTTFPTERPASARSRNLSFNSASYREIISELDRNRSQNAGLVQSIPMRNLDILARTIEDSILNSMMGRVIVGRINQSNENLHNRNDDE
ncbi:hypothetical protein HDU92_007943 [Lobulomyces angularis]|nr:hypothetical protein HDU92_007943 [Lobulomyces angularis]